MNTATAPRWNRVLPGWYSLNLRTTTGLLSAQVIQNELGLWDVKVNDEAIGMTDTLKSAKSLALAA